MEPSESDADGRVGDSPDLPSPARSRATRWLFVLAAAVLAGAGTAWYVFGGAERFAGFCAGLGFGAALAAVGKWFLRRQLRAGGHELVQAVVVGMVVSFAAFMVGMVLLWRLWREALAPASLTAFAVYFGWKLVEIARRTGGSRGRGSSEMS